MPDLYARTSLSETATPLRHAHSGQHRPAAESLQPGKVWDPQIGPKFSSVRPFGKTLAVAIPNPSGSQHRGETLPPMSLSSWRTETGESSVEAFYWTHEPGAVA